MAYERQFFTKGQVLTAEEMNELDAWLAHICGREITAAETNSRGELVFTFRDGGTLNVGEVGGVNAAELTEAVEKALQEAKESGEFDGEPGKPGAPGASGVYVGTGTPTDNAVVWINPVGEPTATEDWEFDLDDGSTDTKTVVVIGSDDATNQGKVAILRMKEADGNWVEIPAIKGVSPVVKVSKSGKVVTVTITDADGVKTAAINDGFDPVVETTKSGKVTTVKITDASGTKTATINDGVDITKVEQTTASSEDGGSNVMTVTLSNGNKSTFTVKNGSKGSPVLVASVSESNEDGGSNVVEFSDGKSVTVKNGKTGGKGDPGKSAYQYAKDGGYTGTESEFMAKLATAYLALTGGAITGVIDASGAKNVLDFGVTGWIRGQTTSGGKFDIFGYSTPSVLQVGGSYPALAFAGKNARPTYNGSNMALLSDIPSDIVPITVTSTDGVAYTATAPFVKATSLAELKGAKLVIIPNMTSTNAYNVTLNVNGLGAQLIKRWDNIDTSEFWSFSKPGWFKEGYPVTVTFNGKYWIIEGMNKPYASDLNGAVAIANGGTGATTAAEARTNLGLKTDTWTATYEDGTVETIEVYVK